MVLRKTPNTLKTDQMHNDTETPSSNPLLEEIRQDITQKNFTIPSLPENTQKIKKLVSDPNTSANKIGKFLSTDPVLTGRIIQAANSPLFRGLNTIQDINQAISRLGMTCIQNLVFSLTVSSLYGATNMTWVRNRMRRVWNESIKIAAISEVLSRPHRHLDNSEALMLGLVHDVGAIPVIQLCAKRFGKPQKPAILDDAIRKISPHLSQWILQNWNLSPKFCKIPSLATDVERHHDGMIDYADIILVAKLHIARNSQHPWAELSWEDIPAFKKLKLTPENSIEVIKEAQSEITEIIQLLKN